MLIEDKLIRELTEKSQIELTDQVVIEDMDGTKLGSVRSLRTLMMDNFIFNNVEDMKCAQLKENDVCITLGYHTVGDGGAAVYRIVYEPTAVDDRANYHYLHSSDVYRAKFVSEDGTVLPEQFGAYGDGEHDDIDSITKCIDSKFKIRFSGRGKYKITKPIPIKSDLTLDFNGSTIIPYGGNAIKKWTTVENDKTIIDDIYNIKIINGNIDMTNSSSESVVLKCNLNDSLIENINIFYNESTGILLWHPKNVIIKKCIFDMSIGIHAVSDNYDYTPTGTPRHNSIKVEDCNFKNMVTGFSLQTFGDDWDVNISRCVAENEELKPSTSFIFISGANVQKAYQNVNVSDIRTYNISIPIQITTPQPTSATNIHNLHATNAWCGVWGVSFQTRHNISLSGYCILDGVNNESRKYCIIMGVSLINMHLNTTNIVYNPETYTESTERLDMTVYDSASPFSYPIKSMSVSGSKLTIPFFRNGIIEITNTGSDITELAEGAENQVIGLRATSTRKIINSGTISLHSAPDATTLTNNKIIYLKCISGRWTEL